MQQHLQECQASFRQVGNLRSTLATINKLNMCRQGLQDLASDISLMTGHDHGDADVGVVQDAGRHLRKELSKMVQFMPGF